MCRDLRWVGSEGRMGQWKVLREVTFKGII